MIFPWKAFKAFPAHLVSMGPRGRFGPRLQKANSANERSAEDGLENMEKLSSRPLSDCSVY